MGPGNPGPMLFLSVYTTDPLFRFDRGTAFADRIGGQEKSLCHPLARHGPKSVPRKFLQFP
jgi:hypothetical protein